MSIAYIKGKSLTISYLNLFDILEKEFGFIFKTQNFVIHNIFNLKFYLLHDILLSFVSWIPTRMIPFAIPESIWGYNTILIASGFSGGTIPTDLVSGSIYEIGLLGVLIIPFVLGCMIKKADKMFCSTEYNSISSVFKFSIATIAINCVSHFRLTQ